MFRSKTSSKRFQSNFVTPILPTLLCTNLKVSASCNFCLSTLLEPVWCVRTSFCQTLLFGIQRPTSSIASIFQQIHSSRRTLSSWSSTLTTSPLNRTGLASIVRKYVTCNLVSFYYRFQYYQRNVQRQQAQLAIWLQKRRAENMQVRYHRFIYRLRIDLLESTIIND